MMPFFNRNPWMMPPPPLEKSRGSNMVHSRFQGRLGNRNNRFQYANQQHNFSNVRKGLHPSNIQRTIFNNMPRNPPRNAGCSSTTNHNNHRQPGFLHSEFSESFQGNNSSLHSLTNSTAGGNGLGGSSNMISPSLRAPFSPSVGFGSNVNQILNPMLREDYAGKVQFDNVRRPAQQGVVAGASKSSVCPDPSIGFRVKKQLCKNYFRGHGCRNGDNCSFMHKDFPCWLFHVKGSCPDGIFCKFSHDDLSAVTRRTLVGNMVKYKDLFPSMSHKEIQAAINVVSAGREKTSGIHGDYDDVIILDVETDVVEVPRQVSNDGPNLWVMSSLVNGQGTGSHEHISFPHATHSPTQTEAPSLHEIVQRTRRVINQSETMRSDGNDELSALNSRQTHPTSGPLFTTITKPVDFKGVPQRKGRATMDAVIESCIGHGPPYTNWQICLIYNACAQNGLNLDTSDLQQASSSSIAP